MAIVHVAIDLSKNVFAVHGVNEALATAVTAKSAGPSAVVSTTMICTHVLNCGGRCVRSPLDQLYRPAQSGIGRPLHAPPGPAPRPPS